MMQATGKKLTLPEPGAHRFWYIKHQPQKKSAPLRIELREKTVRSAKEPVPSLSRLIGFEDIVADETEIENGALRILAVAARVDEFIGVHA